MKLHKIVLLTIFFMPFWAQAAGPVYRATAPLTLSPTLFFGMPQATGLQDGYLAAEDYSSFNNKLSSPLTTKGDVLVYGSANARLPIGTNGQILTADSAQTLGLKWADAASSFVAANLTSPTTGVSVTGGTNAVNGSGTTISVQTATGSQPGLLSAADWTTFNGKQSALTFGNLSTATTGVTVTGGTGAVIGSGAAVNIQTASGSQPGLLSAADWTTFNSKLSSFTETDPLSLHLNGNNSPSADVAWASHKITGLSGITFASGQVLAADGTVSLPVYSLASNTNTGFYKSATNEMSFAFNGTQGVRFTSTTFGGGSVIIPSEVGGLLVGGSYTDPGSAQGGTIIAASSLYGAGFAAIAGGGNSPTFIAKASNGTITSPTAVTNGQLLGAYEFTGYDGTTYPTGGGGAAYMASQAVENWTASAHGSRLVFNTNPSGTTSNVAAMSLDQNQNMTVAGSIATNAGGLSLTNNGFNSVLVTASGTGSWPLFLTQASRGTTGSPTALQSGDLIGSLTFRGYDGSAFSSNAGATVFAATTQNWSGSQKGSDIHFQVVLNGTTALYEAGKITNAGQFQAFGGFSGPSVLLNGSTSGTLTQTVPATVTSYTVKWPNAQGGATTVLTNDGSGNLSWASGGSGANTALSNLTSPTAVNQNLVMGNHDIRFTSPNGLGNAAGIVTVYPADFALANDVGDNIVDWSNGSMMDLGANQIAIDWFARKLHDSAGSQALTWADNKNVTVGTAAIATTATNGFLYIPTCPGAPTGVPTAKTGRSPIVVDTTNNKICFYNGAWKCAVGL